MAIINLTGGQNREITKWKRNYETGEYIEKKCIKPNQLIHGKAQIELFDAITNKKQEECYTENIVTNALNKYAATVFLLGLVPFVSAGTYARNMSSTDNYINIFANMFLTTATDAESVNTKRLLGSVVGWANKYTTYSGSDTLRGTVNQAESEITNIQTIKYVFDFPTHCANGTFQSLFWMPGKVAPTTSRYVECIDTYIGLNSTISVSKVSARSKTCFYNGIYYYISTDKKIYYSILSQFTTSPITSTSILLKDFSATDNDLKGIDWDGTNFWVFGDQNDKMYKLDTTGAEVSSWSITKATYFDSNIQFCCFAGKIYTYRYVDATTWNLYKFATDGTLEATYNLYSASRNMTSGEANGASIASDGDSIFVFDCSDNAYFTVMEVDSAGNVTYEFESDGTLGALNCYALAIDPVSKLAMSNIATTNYFVLGVLLWEPVAQTLLPAGVTKTNTQTMKVTYTFNLDLTSL